MSIDKSTKKLMGKNILVTGGNGFIGRHLITYLKKLNHNISNLGSTPIDGISFFKLHDPINFNDVENAILLSRPEIIFHLAGSKPSSNLETSFTTNTLYGIKILECLEHLKMEHYCKILFVGSAAEYGVIKERQLPVKETTLANPLTPYGISKLATSNLAVKWQKKGRHITVVRPFTILGSNMPTHMALGNFINQIEINKCKELQVGNLSTQRDFIDVRDFVKIIYRLMHIPSSAGQIYNICSGKSIFIKDILEYYIKKTKSNIEIKTNTNLLRQNDMSIHYGSNKKLSNILDPINLIDWKASVDEIIKQKK